MPDSLQLLLSRWSRQGSYRPFAWLCILVLPPVLNILIGLSEDSRSGLGEYYGAISLFIMFQLCLGFSTLFLGTMLATHIGRSGLIDELRLSRTRPRSLLGELLLHSAGLLLPPLFAFLLLSAAWLAWQAHSGLNLSLLYLDRALVFLLQILLAQLCCLLAIYCGLGRRIPGFVLLGVLVQLLMTTLPVYLLVSQALHWSLILLLSLGLSVALFLAATYNLIRLWPPK